MRVSFSLGLVVLFGAWSTCIADDKPPADNQPKILLTQPLAVAAGATTRVALRGLKLESTSEVRCAAGVTVKIVGQGGAVVPKNVPATRCGDQQVEVELQVPANTPAGTIPLVVVTKQGESVPRALIVADANSLLQDKEPNDDFRRAQPIDKTRTLDGVIHQNQNVDVYRFDAAAGEKLTIDVQAARLGSALDVVLTLFDAEGRIIAACDDAPGTTDATLDATLAAAGAYFVSIADAHDLGGNSHPYRLSIRSR